MRRFIAIRYMYDYVFYALCPIVQRLFLNDLHAALLILIVLTLEFKSPIVKFRGEKQQPRMN